MTVQVSEEEYERLIRGQRKAPPNRNLAKALACLSVGVLAFVVVLVNWGAIKAHVPPMPIIMIATPAETAAKGVVKPATPLPARNPGGSFNDAGAANAAYAAAVAKQAGATPLPTSTPPSPKMVVTWADGSQSYADGTPIDAEHSQAGFCKLIVLEGGLWCENEAAPGTIIATAVPSPPTPIPAYVKPSQAVTYTATDGPDGNTCVTVTFPDAHTQTACSEAGWKYNQANIDYVGQMIESGQIQPGHNAPKG